MNDKWIVIHLGPEDGYGIAVHRVTMLELFCRGMQLDAAKEVCALLNGATKRPPRRD